MSLGIIPRGLALCASIGFATLISAVALADESLFQFSQKPGPFAVGLKIENLYDYSRSFRDDLDKLGHPSSGQRARPLQVLIWYPATRSDKKPLSVHDYVSLWASETVFDRPRMPVQSEEWLSAMKPTLSMSLRAVRDAPSAPGRFPVVIYAPGFSGVSWENADLCEYLASFGYLVMSSPSMGEHTRAMTADLRGIDAQARDISFLAGYSRELDGADLSAIAVIGSSWGGIANLFAAARDSRIGALVALDGTLRYYPALVAQAGDVHPEAMTIPLLFFAAAELSLEDQERYFDADLTKGSNVLNAWTHGDLVSVHMLGLDHAQFNSNFLRNEDSWTDFPRWQTADYGREDAFAGYAWVALYTRRFLDAYLKHDDTGMAFLERKPAENGVPQHFLSISVRHGSGIPPSFEGFRAEVVKQGFGHANEILATMQRQNPGLTLEEGRLLDWAEKLITDGRSAEAIDLLNLNAQMYPKSSETYMYLGVAYAKLHNNSKARDCLRKSIELNPVNSAYRERQLEELEGHRAP